MRSVTVNIIVATAGTIPHGMTRMMVDWVPAIAMDALVAAAGAIVQRMARMMGDRVVSCPHDICRSLR